MTKLNYDPILGLVSWEFVNTEWLGYDIKEADKMLKTHNDIDAYLREQEYHKNLLSKAAGVPKARLGKNKRNKGRSREERKMWERINKITKKR
jgi:hypothetical protein